MNHFNEIVCEHLDYYVYALVDPRNGKIFYIGKGKGNRIFQHCQAALNHNEASLKIKTIETILAAGCKVKHYIIRHGLTEKEAYKIESTLIDFLSYSDFNHENVLTNIMSGYHQWDEGIKTVEEINILYDCPQIEVNNGDFLLLVNINRSFNQTKAEGIYQRPNIYEATRKYWAIGRNKAKSVKYVLGVYKGVVRIVIEVESYKWVAISEDGFAFKKERCCFDGKILEDSQYLNKAIPSHLFGNGSAIAYLPK